jgi:two-component system, chemotaxis family, CheB/CheR fusion protein
MPKKTTTRRRHAAHANATATKGQRPSRKRAAQKSIDAGKRASASTAPADSLSDRPTQFPIVGIGASAGGLDAFKRLLEQLPNDTGMAFVLVPHLHPQHQSMLSELLGRVTHLPVAQADDGDTVRPNRVYVIPPDRELTIEAEVLRVTQRVPSTSLRLPIDNFLTSLAADVSSRAIGVILSGSGSDGTHGLQAIKAEGGITFAQLEQSAQYESMPHSAISAGAVDFVLAPEDIAAELKRLSRHPYVQARPTGRDPLPEANEALTQIFALLRSRTGNDFTYYKHSTLKRRIKRRMLLHKLERVEDYVRYLHEQPDEVDALFQELLINVTHFFRDPDTFDALKRHVLPAITRGRGVNEPVRVWVPGCSTGEEVYSVAMILVEHLAEQSIDGAVEIFGTDIDDVVIGKAREGVYRLNIEADVSPERLKRFFSRSANHYRISRSIRDMCVFAVQNAIKDPPFSHIDLILCRNLMIYLEPVLQARLLQTFHYALNPAGFLMLGTSETTGRGTELFRLVDKHAKIYARKSAPPARRRDPSQVPLLGTHERRRALPQGSQSEWNLQQHADQMLLAKYSPPGVVVDESLDIVHFQGDTSAYLSPTPGAASLNLLRLARRELAVELRGLTKDVIKHNREARREGVRLGRQRPYRRINLSALPIKPPEARERYFLILFEHAPAAASTAMPKHATRRNPSAERRIEELERELMSTRDYLQSIIEEQEATNEELRSANEEILSSNEELQSTNEELETGKEELQSMNEELSTVNEELHNTNADLAQVNDDLNNLLASANIPIVMLTRDQRIRHFTPATKDVMTLIPSDVGRPISDIRFRIAMPPIEPLLDEVTDTFMTRTLEVSSPTGNTYVVHLRPYRTADQRVTGTVLVFNDVTERHKRSEQERRLATVVRDAHDAITVIDANGRFIAWNRGAERMYGYTEAEALRLWFTDLVPEGDRKSAKEQIERVLRGESVDSLETRRRTKDDRLLDVWLTLSRLTNEAGEPVAVATTERDVTARNREARELRRMAAVVRNSQDAVIVTGLQGDIQSWNTAAEQLFGYSNAEAVGMNIVKLWPQEQHDVLHQILRTSMQGQPVKSLPTKQVKRSGEVIAVHTVASLLLDAGQPTAIAFTERLLKD